MTLAPTRGNPPRTARTSQNWRGRPAEHSKKTISFLHDLVLAKMYFVVVVVVVVACNVLLNLPNAIVLAAYTERIKTLHGVVQVNI